LKDFQILREETPIITFGTEDIIKSLV